MHHIDDAVAALRAGALCVIPTETVYGLAADARNAAAVQRIFSTKGRPADHPLIVHLAGVDDIDAWAIDIPPFARLLAAAYWPGPLTLILRKDASVLDIVTGGQDSVGLRVPAHDLTREVIARLGSGIAAPSANRFGKVSPTTAKHVIDDIGELLQPTDAVLDGGPCSIGVESTIVDCTGPQPRLLRTGAITIAMIEETTGLDVLAADGTVRASGTLASHYAPAAKVHVAEASGIPDIPGAGLIALREIPTPVGMTRLLAAADDGEFARGLYAALRSADTNALTDVVAVLPSTAGLGSAIRDRLARAAHAG